MVLEFFEKIAFKFGIKFFMELKYHGKLEFPKLKYPKTGKSIHISEIVVN